jgi:hypothetical protein
LFKIAGATRRWQQLYNGIIDVADKGKLGVGLGQVFEQVYTDGITQSHQQELILVVTGLDDCDRTDGPLKDAIDGGIQDLLSFGQPDKPGTLCLPDGATPLGLPGSTYSSVVDEVNALVPCPAWVANQTGGGGGGGGTTNNGGGGGGTTNSGGGNGNGTGGGTTLTIPATPINVVATPLSTTQIQVTWQSGGGNVDHYNIDNGCPVGYQGCAPGDSLTGSTSSTSYTFTTTPGKYQCFRVLAVNAAGNSDWSSYGCTTTPS